MTNVVAGYLKLLGYKCKDRVTGFEGVIGTISFDLYGCVQAAVIPEVKKDGTRGDGEWFDTKRLEITSKKRVMEPPDFITKILGDENGAGERPRAAVR